MAAPSFMNQMDGYIPNTARDITTLVVATKFAGLATLDSSLSSSTVKKGYLVSKKVVTPGNPVLYVLPTEASVLAGNLWFVAGGVYPDEFNNIDSVQDAVSQALDSFGAGAICSVIPMMAAGTVVQAFVSIGASTTVTPNLPLYVKADGTLTTVAADALADIRVGYIAQSDTATTTGAVVVQCYVVLTQSLQPAA